MRTVLLHKLLLIAIASIVSVSSAFSADKPLGIEFGVKVDYFRFLDNTFRHAKMDRWAFVGIEAYKEINIPNLFVGVETGWAGTSGLVAFYEKETSATINYVPIEFNVKYRYEIIPRWILDFGAGISYNWFLTDINETEEGLGTLSVTSSDWVIGGQVFAGLKYKIGNWAFGANAKYQVTEDVEIYCSGPAPMLNVIFPGGAATGISRRALEIGADNVRIGGTVEYRF